ncbi:MAG: hypothetical protein H7Y19_13175 [Luteimonas sp.]|nr:hypothetical protein [Luteimonas sp.]
MHRTSLLALVCTLTLAAGAAGAAPPAVVDLGGNHLAQDVSDDGAVVAGLMVSFDGDPGEAGVSRWTAATGTQVIGGIVAGRPDLSADGTTIAGTVMTDRAEAAFWTQADGWKPLGALELIPPLPGWTTTSNAISANGQRLAGATTPPPVDWGHVRAFSFNPDTWDDRWADFGWTELPKTHKASFGEATGITDDGLVQVGIASEPGGAYRAVRWTDGRVEELRDGNNRRLGGESVRCNTNCNVIVGGGGGSSAVNPILAWRLLPKTRQPACYFKRLSGPPLLALRYYAYGTNESGNVVVGAYYYDDPPQQRNIAKGFLWIGDARGGTMHDLQTYLSGLGQPFLDDWFNVVPTAVSADGRYLVGWGDDPQGQLRGWRVDFGGAPQVRGPAADYTQCPTTRSPMLPVTKTARAADALPWVRPFGEFRSAEGQRYYVSVRGAKLYGGTRKDRLSELLPLGGDHYYDAAGRVRRSFTRSAAGAVKNMQVRGGSGAVALWRRQAD